VKGKAGRGAGIVVGMTTMKRKQGTEIEVIMEGTSAGAGTGAETVKGKGGGRGDEPMSMREVGSMIGTGTAATGEERNDTDLCSSYIAFANFCSHGTRGLVLVTGGVHYCSESDFLL